MSITKQTAWPIFKAVALGQPEGRGAIARMTKGEFEAYECLKEDFEFEIARVSVEAQNEAAGIWEAHPNTKEVLETITPSRWTADNYWSLVSIFKGSKYEQLHLSAMFRFTNNEVLLDHAAPQS